MRIEKIHDIRRHLAFIAMSYELYPSPRVGVVNLKMARVLAFVIIVLSVVASAITCLLAVWEVIAPLYAWRTLESLAIVAASVIILLSLNEGFGPAVRGYPLARINRGESLHQEINPELPRDKHNREAG